MNKFHANDYGFAHLNLILSLYYPIYNNEFGLDSTSVGSVIVTDVAGNYCQWLSNPGCSDMCHITSSLLQHVLKMLILLTGVETSS